tara:strand:+ start:2027 stop:2266 length:240 start_codon:yes stop_codon:yes gene_type:complete
MGPFKEQRMAIKFTYLGGPFRTTTARNDSGYPVATIRRIGHPRFGKMWGVNSRLINGWRYFNTVAEAKAEITKAEEQAA